MGLMGAIVVVAFTLIALVWPKRLRWACAGRVQPVRWARPLADASYLDRTGGQ